MRTLIAVAVAFLAACGGDQLEQLQPDSGLSCRPDWSWCVLEQADGGAELVGAP